MDSSAIGAGATGIVTVSIAGFQVVLDHADLLNWGNSIMSLAPLLLILFLIWRMYKLDQQHKNCQENYAKLQESQSKMQEQIMMTFLATKHPDVCQLPAIKEFKDNEFIVPHV